MFAVAFFIYCIIIGRLGYLQLIKGDELQAKAQELRLREVPVAAKRGEILDRNGSTLAISISADSIYASPPDVKSSKKEEEIATQLAEILGMDKETVLQKITADQAFVWLKRKADFDKAEEVKEADLSGIHIIQETQRFYPQGVLASHILGFAGIDNQGLEGIEKSCDEELKGVDGSIVTEYDAQSREIPQSTQRYNAPTDGYTLVLTIDKTLQYFAERELDKLMNSETPPKGCSILMMNPKTGEILAMASRPTYDPNNYGNYTQEDLRNKCVVDTYEPGSTFKMIISAAALEEGIVTPESRFYDPGYAMVGKTKIKCWRWYNPHGSQSFAEIIQNSCNPGFVEVGLRMEEKEKGTVYRYLKAFGFGQKTGIELPGEASGIMIAEDKLSKVNIATISIGQSIAVTPIQLVTAVSAVANGGTLLKPQIVREVRSADGNVLEEFQVREVRRVISEQTSQTTCELLEKVVSKGTAKQAFIPGYRVAGKTGTAQKAGNGGYMDGKYVASFCGFAPANDPQVVALVILDEPSGALYQGGQVAAPVFKPLMEDTLRYLGVPAQELVDTDLEDDLSTKTLVVPDVSGLSYEQAEKALQAAGFKVENKNSGTYVKSQLPAGFAKVAQGSTVVLTMTDSSSDGLVVVPDLTGRRVREAVDILGAFGLNLQAQGTGLAGEQNPIPGQKVQAGSTVTIQFAEEQTDPVSTGP